MDYTNASMPKVLPAGKYSVTDAKYNWMKGTITVSPSQKSTGNLVVGGFYTPTNQVANNKDNDGGAHPGWLGYYKTEFPSNGFKILSLFDFHYATCKYCPGGILAGSENSRPHSFDIQHRTVNRRGSCKVDKDGLEQCLHIKTIYHYVCFQIITSLL